MHNGKTEFLGVLCSPLSSTPVWAENDCNFKMRNKLCQNLRKVYILIVLLISKMVKINKIEILKCKRCLHRWIPRQQEVMMCPRCKSVYWNKNKKEVD